MAKRKRLTPAQPGYLGGEPPAAPETKAAPLAPPIAQVAGEASARAALQELSGLVNTARDEGRLIRNIPLAAVQADYMLRDRLLAPEDEDMQALIASLRARGQQTPIDVVDLGEGRFGLVSGLRRLTALRVLQAEGGPEQVKARLIVPQDGADSYVSMVEENEIRAGLSFYERARIVVKAVEAGVFPDLKAGLRGLYGNVARAKRSKIKSFTTLVSTLDHVLRFPARLSERQGLALAKALAEDPDLAARLQADLSAAPAESPEAEWDRLEQAGNLGIKPPVSPEHGAKTAEHPEKTGKTEPKNAVKSDDPQTMQTKKLYNSGEAAPKGSGRGGSIATRLGNGLTLQVLDGGGSVVVKGLTPELQQDLREWLAAR